MLLGFRQHSSNGRYNFLCLKKTLFGLHQSPHDFLNYLTENLVTFAYLKILLTPCLIIGENIIIKCYVDDLIFCARNERILFIWMSSYVPKKLILSKTTMLLNLLEFILHTEHNPKTESSI